MNAITSELTQLCKQLRIDVYGAGGIARFADSPRGHHPEELLPGAKSVFSIAMPVIPATYDWDRRLRDSELFPEIEISAVKKTCPPTRKEIVEHIRTELGAETYRAMYDLVSSRLDDMTYELARFLLANGHDALWYPTSSPIMVSQAAGGASTWRNKYQVSAFSQTVAGYYCGLGTIGLNHVLITPKYGPRVRVNSIITSAELDESPMLEELCNRCGKCVKMCPSKAFGAIKTEVFSGREVCTAEMDKQLCLNSRNLYHESLDTGNIFDRVQNCDCGGLCVKYCPIGSAPRPFQKPYDSEYK